MDRDTKRFVTRELWVEHGVSRIYGVLHLPKGAEQGTPLPAVICSHFFGGTHRTSSKYARALATQGFVIYAFDFCGGSPESRSTGVTTECSIRIEEEDLSAILDAIRDLPGVDASRVFLLGQSQGGAVSAMLAAARPQDVAGLVLCYPAFVIHDDAVRRFGTTDKVPETYHMWLDLGRAYAVDAIEYDFFERIGAYAGPVLLFQGDEDDMEPPAYTERAARLYAHACLEVIQGAGHGFHGADFAHVIDRTAELVRMGEL